ncbi:MULTISPECIES: hypothetical protein [Actinomycetes]|uniref:hypothetical protein n=1 Tax=Actinomycetes TaxID=1760 RepID=UPI0012DE8177|nr:MULTISPECIES: hypothetical protein [Actinomycetes]
MPPSPGVSQAPQPVPSLASSRTTWSTSTGLITWPTLRPPLGPERWAITASVVANVLFLVVLCLMITDAKALAVAVVSIIALSAMGLALLTIRFLDESNRT